MARTMVDILRQQQQARETVSSWRKEQEQNVQEQAEETRQQLTSQIGETEAQAQQTLQKARTELAKKRKISLQVEREIPTITKKDIKEIERAEREAISAGQKGKQELEQAKTKALTEIEQVATEAIKDVDTQTETAIAEVQKFAEKNVELNFADKTTGASQWVDRDWYNTLSNSDKQLVNTIGIDAYNKVKQREFESDNVKLDYIDPKTGANQWVSQEIWDSIKDNKEARDYLKKNGVEAFNKWANSNYQASIQEIRDSYSDYPLVQKAIDSQGIGVLDLSSLTPQQQFEQYKTWGIITDKDATYISGTADSGFTYSIQGQTTTNNTPTQKLNRIDPSTGDFELVSQDWYDSMFGAEATQKATEEGNAKEFSERKNYLLNNGYDAFMNKYYIKTATDEYIDRKFYDSITGGTLDGGAYSDSYARNYLLTNGYDAFVNKFYVTLKTGELVEKDWYSKLTAQDQSYLNAYGVQGYNDKIQMDSDSLRLFYTANYVTLNNGDMIERVKFNKMSKADQDLIMKLGAEKYNTQKQNEFISSLPKEAQEYINKVGYDKFNQAFNNAVKTQSEGKSPDGQLKVMGLIPEYAINVKILDDGSVAYEGSPSLKYAKTVDLNKVDYQNMSDTDYWNIAKTVMDDGKYDTYIGNNPVPSTAFSVLKFAKTLPEADRKALEAFVNDRLKNNLIDIISFVLPHFEAVKSDVTWDDVNKKMTTGDWIAEIAIVASLIAAPIVGAVAKGGATAVKVAQTGGKIVNAGVTGAFITATAVDWVKMSPAEQAANVALNAILVGALFGKTIAKAAKVLTSDATKKISSSFSIATSEIKKASLAIKSGNVEKLKAAAVKMQEVGTKIQGKSYTAGTTLYEKGRFIEKNAKEIIANAKVTKLSDVNAKWLNNVVETSNKSLGASSDLESQASKWIRAREESDRLAFNTKGSPYEGKIVSPSIKTTTITREEYYAQKAEEITKQLADKMRADDFAKVLKTLELSKSEQERLAMLERYAKEKNIEITNKLKASEIKQAEILKQAKLAKTEQIKKVNWEKVKNKWVEEMNRVTAKQAEIVKDTVKKIDNPELKQLIGDATAEEIAIIKAKLASANVSKVLTEAQNIAANKAIQMLMKQNLITAAIATNVQAFTRIYSNASNKVQSLAQTKVSPAIETMLKTMANDKASVETKAKAASKVQALAQVEVKALTEILTSAESNTKSMTDSIAQTIAKTISSTSTSSSTKAEIDAMISTATKPITDTAVKEAVKTKVETLLKTEPVTRIDEIRKPRFYKPITINLKERSVTLTPEELNGSVGWKQGIMYWLLYPPYKDNNYIATRKPIKGIPYHDGIGSAYRSLIKIGGKLPSRIFRDMGIMDIKIVTTGKKPKIEFKRDIEQKTTITGIKVSKR